MVLWVYASFRTQMSAAPLKLSHAVEGGEQGQGFRTQMSAAPLKHLTERGEDGARGRFPHSDECGPIEASGPLTDCTIGHWSFRTQMSAAPLKPGRRGRPGTGDVLFPHSDECGPIEAAPAARCPLPWKAPRGFPHSDECGPIEALDQADAALSMDAVSALR